MTLADSTTTTATKGAIQPRVDRLRLPSWLRVNLPKGAQQGVFNKTHATVDGNRLYTVCEEAKCPNVHDCWSRGTATFMIAGKECTRGCRFCSVETIRSPAPPNRDEPERIAAAVASMELEHVVITVVNRDDLPDGGASHYRQCVDAIHFRSPRVTIELLSSDLAGDEGALEVLLHGSPLDVFAHNVECAERLDAAVRDPRASFEQSLTVLRNAKRIRPDVFTKSSLMVGLGEIDDEVSYAMQRLRGEGVDILTLGQYLAPGRSGQRYAPVDRYVPPTQFQAWADEAKAIGFLAVASAPLVRSSYRAGKLLTQARATRGDQ